MGSNSRGGGKQFKKKGKGTLFKKGKKPPSQKVYEVVI